MKYYPVFLNIESKRAVVIGGGPVAERKTIALLKSGAIVTVVSPDLTERLAGLKTDRSIRHLPRKYRKADIRDAFIVIAATGSPDVNRQVSGDATGLVNVVDVPELCNFIMPSVISKGPLTIAISTGGVSPALSKTIRKELEKQYGAEISGYLEFIEGIRKQALTDITDKVKRERFFKGLASNKILKTLRTGGLAEVKKTVLKKLALLTR